MEKRKAKALRIAALIVAFFVLLSGCGLMASSGGSKDNKQVFASLQSTSSIDEAMSILKEITSEKYDGRLVGTEGNKLAQQYIVDYFKKLGLKSPEGIDNYLQPYTQKTVILNSKPEMNIIGKGGTEVKKFEYLADFVTRVMPGAMIKGEVTAPIAVVNSLDELIKSTELGSKIVLIPQNVRLQAGIASLISAVESKGDIKGVVCEDDLNNPNRETHYFSTNVYVIEPSRYNNQNGPVFAYCNSNVFSLLKNSAGGGNSLNIKVDYSCDDVKTANVIGVLSGTDERLKDEYIIISCHYDHIGDNKNGTYNPGAFDNGSGTAAVLDIASSLVKSKDRPKRPVMFIAFNGEEEGLLGSQYFVRNPVCDLKKATVINLDMVGHKKVNPLSIMSAQKGKSQLTEDLLSYGKALDMDCKTEFEDRSDHAPLQAGGAQAVTLIEWELSTYHNSEDTIDTIDKEDLNKAVELVLYYIAQKAY